MNDRRIINIGSGCLCIPSKLLRAHMASFFVWVPPIFAGGTSSRARSRNPLSQIRSSALALFCGGEMASWRSPVADREGQPSAVKTLLRFNQVLSQLQQNAFHEYQILRCGIAGHTSLFEHEVVANGNGYGSTEIARQVAKGR